MILLVTSNTKRSEELLSRGVINLCCHADAAFNNFLQYDISGVCCDQQELTSFHKPLLEQILAQNANIPLLFYREDAFTLQNLLDFCTANCHIERPLHNYYLSVGNNEKEVFLHGYPLKLSHSEYKILRLVFLLAPKPTPLHFILSVCFPNQPFTNKSVQIMLRSINKKSVSATGKTLLRITRVDVSFC